MYHLWWKLKIVVGFEDIDTHQSGSVSFVVKTEDGGGF